LSHCFQAFRLYPSQRSVLVAYIATVVIGIPVSTSSRYLLAVHAHLSCSNVRVAVHTFIIATSDLALASNERLASFDPLCRWHLSCRETSPALLDRTAPSSNCSQLRGSSSSQSHPNPDSTRFHLKRRLHNPRRPMFWNRRLNRGGSPSRKDRKYS